jgi:RNA polymerase sigma-70 factor (ECF subfamily)
MTAPSNDNTEQFVRLLARHERRVEAFVLSLVPNWSDAEEIIQETKLRLWQQYAEYDPAKDFGAWACTIAYYQVLTLRNRNRGQHVALGQAFLERVAAEIARRSDREINRAQQMADCLRKLDEAKRQLLKRHYSARETHVQIAADLGRKADSVRQELLRIRRTLYRCIEESGHGEDAS